MRRAFACMLVVMVSVGIARACSLNPQPLPPGEQPDSSSPTIGGSSGGGGSNGGSSGGGSGPAARKQRRQQQREQQRRVRRRRRRGARGGRRRRRGKPGRRRRRARGGRRGCRRRHRRCRRGRGLGRPGGGRAAGRRRRRPERLTPEWTSASGRDVLVEHVRREVGQDAVGHAQPARQVARDVEDDERVGLEVEPVERVHVLAREPDEARGRQRAHRRRARLHVEHRHLAEPVAGPEDRDAHVAPAPAPLGDLHLAVEDDVHLARRAVALAEDGVAGADAHRLQRSASGARAPRRSARRRGRSRARPRRVSGTSRASRASDLGALEAIRAQYTARRSPRRRLNRERLREHDAPPARPRVVVDLLHVPAERRRGSGWSPRCRAS